MNRSGPRTMWGGRIRVSTVELIAAFLAVFVLYILVRPEPVETDNSTPFDTPSVERAPAKPHRPRTERRAVTPTPTTPISPAVTPVVTPSASTGTGSPKPAPITEPAAPVPLGPAPMDKPTPRSLLHLLAPTPTP